ncbi:MAG: hypothetical protein ABW321_31585 [Polyangiales bacterium]
MSKQQSKLNADIVWYVASRASAVALVVLAVLLAVKRADHSAKTEALALAVHRTYVAEDMKSRPLQRLAESSRTNGSR